MRRPVTIAFLALATLFAFGCDQGGEELFVLDPGPDRSAGERAMMLDITGHAQVKPPATITFFQEYRQEEEAIVIETEGVLLDIANLERIFPVRDPDEPPSRKHISVISGVVFDENRAPENDLLFAVQLAAGDGEWIPVEPPPSYQWRRIVRLTYEPEDGWFLLSGEACRHRRDDDGVVRRRCEFATRWQPLDHSAGLRFIPFPVRYALEGEVPPAQLSLTFSVLEQTPGR